MRTTTTRRTFLRAGVTATAGSAALVGRSRGATAETAILSGTVTPENGADVGDDQVQANSRNSPNHVRTDRNGRFEIELEANTEYKLGYYRSHSGTSLAPERKGVPHIYKLGSEYLGTEDKDLGEMVLPRAYLVDLRILKANGEPLFGSDMTYRHFGWGGGNLSLNEEGYATLDGASFTGVELAEHARVEVEPPDRGDYEDTTYKNRASVTGPVEFVVRIDSDGANWTVNEDEPSETTAGTTSGTTETTETTSGTPRTTAGGTTRKTTGTPPQSTTPGTTKVEPVTGSNRSGTRTGEKGAAEPKRGFFSNGQGASDLGMLNDPFVLTVGGFVLSVAGIAHNLVRGH